MTPDRGQHPQPQPARIPPFTTAFGLLGGPFAWFVLLCAGYGLASWSCFPKDHRGVAPIEGVDWSWPTMVGLLAVCVIIASLSLLASWRVLQQTRQARERDYYHVIEDGDGRLAFLALWGVLLGAGFAITTLLNVIAYVVLPRCGG